MKLTEHFTLEAMLRSQTATRLGISEQFYPKKPIIDALEALCFFVLEPLRIAIGKPIHINSGYRCARLNRNIGGVSNSQHISGEAVDITVEGMTNVEIISAIKKLELPVDQCIEEFGSWVHVSHCGKNRNQFLTAHKLDGKTVYTNYIS